MNIAAKLLPIWLLAALSLACSAVNYLPLRSTATPTVTPSPTSTPTPTPTPTPPPTPTPLPEARVAQGDRAVFYGDWDTALREYEAVLASNPDPALLEAAWLGLGRTHYLAGDFEQAEQNLRHLLGERSASPLVPQAYFFLGQILSSQDRHLEAAEAYLNYLALRPGVIDAYVYELRGDALYAAGDYPGAIVEYQAGLQSPRLSSGLPVEIKMARAYALSGDYATAIVAYQDIYNRTTNDYTKAQMDLLIGQAYLALEDTESAHAAFLDAVSNFPQSYDSYTALLALVEAGVPVDEFQRGLVDYYAGEYGVALAAFDRYLQTSPGDSAAGLFYRGLAQSALGDYPAAIQSWDRVIESHPDSGFWDRAWEEKAFSQWFYLDQHLEAVDTLTAFVAAVPNHLRAGEFLFDAASVAERAGKLERAAKLWERTANEYPAYERAVRALYLAGITRYRMENYQAAREIFQKMLPLELGPADRSAALLWIGKTQQATGDSAAAQASWTQAAEVDPTGYYSERARDLLNGLAPFTPPQEYDLGFDLQAERSEAEAWVRTVFSLEEDTDLSGPGHLQDDPRFQRGNELWQLGLYDEARLEFEDLRQSVSSDPADTFRLANHLIDLGMYRSGILGVRQVLTLAGMDDAETMSAPVYFNHVRFGPYFRELIIQAAQTHDFHPLFLFSVVRQESLFEGFAQSSAAARGLMQIIPSTGQEVASNLGWPENYTTEDLYRPLVSVTLGCEYLARQRVFLEGDLYAALAAYNGGPGNSATWRELAPDDPDLFLEVIRFEETRNYIKRIYEIFSIYRRIYDRTP